MNCPLLKPDEEGIKKAGEIILKGGVIAFPTESFYGLGADAYNEEALRRIFKIKGREESKPLLLLIADVSWVAPLVKSIPPKAKILMEKFWPGPLTLVFEARDHLSPMITAGTGKVGLRISSNPLSQTLVATVNRPITGTSANLSGQPSLSLISEVIKILGDKLDGILDGGETRGGLGSTVLDISGSTPLILRQGAVPYEALAPFLF